MNRRQVVADCEIGDLPQMGSKGQVLLHDDGVGPFLLD
jgi:hypothetical protein